MKIIALLLLLATPSFCQWRPVDISSENSVGAIEENFRRASVYSNRKLDKYSNDIVYGTTTFNGGIKFSDGTGFSSGFQFAYGDVRREFVLSANSLYYALRVDTDGALLVDPTSNTSVETLFVQGDPDHLYKNYIDTDGVLANSITSINIGVTRVVLYTAAGKLYYLYINSDGSYSVDYIGQL